MELDSHTDNKKYTDALALKRQERTGRRITAVAAHHLLPRRLGNLGSFVDQHHGNAVADVVPQPGRRVDADERLPLQYQGGLGLGADEQVREGLKVKRHRLRLYFAADKFRRAGSCLPAFDATFG